MPEPKKIACIGEVMIELIAEKKGWARIGVAGDTYNTAVYLSKISDPADLDISYVTALGTDTFSRRILDELSRYDISTRHIEFREDLMPGLYAIETDAHGERSFSYWRGQSAARSLFEAPCQVTLQALFDFDCLYLSGISLAILPPRTREALIAFLVVYRKAGGKVAFDSNYRPRLWNDIHDARNMIMKMWTLADIALPSLDDEMLLFGDADEESVRKRLVDAGVTFGALKRGVLGPLPIQNAPCENAYVTVEQIVDTTAAGDSFNAGFLASCLKDRPWKEALMEGHKLATKVIQARGAIVDI